MIESSIISNRYLSDSERQNLVNAVSSMGSLYSPVLPGKGIKGKLTQKEPDLQDICERVFWPQETSPNADYTLLKKINLLYQAVSQGLQISMVTGRFQNDGNHLQPKLVPIHEEKPFILNPYALFFDNGHQYLLATKVSTSIPKDKLESQGEQIWHFRVDRIVRLELMPDPEDHTRFLKREIRPQHLNGYWEGTDFDQNAYVIAHPLMAIHKEPNLVTCTLTGQEPALSVMSDAFSQSQMRITNVDTTGPKKVYQVKVRAQYESLVIFCTQHHELLTALEPPELRNEVRTKLIESLVRYHGEPSAPQEPKDNIS